MRQVSVQERLTYISDAALGAVDVFTRAGSLIGTITGLSEPQSVFVDAGHDLWVANTTGNGSSGGNILEYARGGTSPIASLSDAGNYPVDVTICGKGTVDASNIFNLQTGIGSISMYANGATSPTGILQYPGQSTNDFITCDAKGNVFTTLMLTSGPEVVEYPDGNQSAAKIVPIPLAIAGGIKACEGHLYVAGGNGIVEYTESGLPTGKSIAANVVDIGLTRGCGVVGGAVASLD